MRRRTRTASRGGILVCVLVCIGVASTIMLTALTATLRARRQIRQEMQLEQTRWLVEAGMIRGSRAAQRDAQYKGENWSVGSALGDNFDADVAIVVTNEDAAEGKILLQVTAEIRGTDPNSKTTRRSRQWLIDRPEKDSQEQTENENQT